MKEQEEETSPSTEESLRTTFYPLPNEAFPVLSDPTFDATLKFADELDVVTRRLPAGYGYHVTSHIAPEVIDVWSAITTKDPNEFPEDNAEAISALLAAFRPIELAARVLYLQALTW